MREFRLGKFTFIKYEYDKDISMEWLEESGYLASYGNQAEMDIAKKEALELIKFLMFSFDLKQVNVVDNEEFLEGAGDE